MSATCDKCGCNLDRLSGHQIHYCRPPSELPSSTGSDNFVRLFKPQFAPMVLSGEKCQTIRPTPKRMPKRGDKISLRTWTGLPYRSKQRVLREAVIDWVQPIRITPHGITLDHQMLSEHQEWNFAKADGFNTPQDLLEWFNFTHGLPFEGIVIYWQNDKR